MDEKFATLAALVQEARKADRDAFVLMEEARTNWKKANELLTDRSRVLDGYVEQLKNEAIAIND